jgi:diguanylate cyclase (GGDEF)-like protein
VPVGAERTKRVGAGWRPRSWSVATRLMALMLVPLLALLLVSVTYSRTQIQAADEAGRVQEAVDRVARLVALRVALANEHVASDATITSARLGLDPARTNALMGFDVTERLRTTRPVTDAALAALGSSSVVEPQQVEEARSAIDRAKTDASVPPDTLLQLSGRVNTWVMTALRSTRFDTGNSVAAQQLSATLGALRPTLNAVDASHDVLLYLKNLFLSMGDQPTMERNLVAANTRSEVAVRELEETSAVAGAWARVRDDPVSAPYLQDMAAAAAGNRPSVSGGGQDLERLAAMSRAGLTHEQNLFAMVASLTATAHDIAADIETAAVDDLHKGIALPVLAAVAAIIVSWLFGRSISVPMHRLAEHANAIRDGELDLDPLRGPGPRDVTVAFEAFDDLVANLRLLEAKTQALADMDLESPVLAEPLPGRLGSTLQRSASVLSGSLGERDDLRRRLHQQATHDALTGLHNRAAAIETIDLSLSRSRRTDTGVAVLHLALDDFKRINDTHGLPVGDGLLQAMATRLRLTAPEAAQVARIGGDEFIILVEDVRDAGEVNVLARRLRDIVARPVGIAGIQLGTSASIGIAFSWEGTEEATQLLTCAHLAVDRAKARQRGSIEIYDENLQRQVRETAEIEEALTTALRADQLFLQYQPVVDLATGAMSSVEALVRWQRPDLGVLPPDSFIPVAERSDLIISLDRWVMSRAARQMEEWRSVHGLDNIAMAINVSGRHLASQTLHTHVVDLLDSTGVDPERLVVEVTETVLVNDVVSAAAQLEAVRRRGVRIALDDFGTGYTSITHLRHLPIDIIKIDRSFVSRLDDERDRTLLSMVTDLGHHLGLTITAEGVETPEQYETLRRLGCDRAQGFLMSRPLSTGNLVDWVQERADRPASYLRQPG